MSYLGITKRKKQRKKNGAKTLFSIAIVVILIVFFSMVKVPGISKISDSILSVVFTVSKSVKGILTEGFSYFGSIKELNNENKKLKEDIGDLKYKLLETSTLESDNESLRVKLEIKERFNHFKLKYADIILRNYDSWNETFTINKGSEDGLKEKQAVITEDGLVGYIAKTNKKTSVVKTILSPSVAIGVDIASVNKNALAKGDFSLKDEGKLKLTYIPIDTEISVSEIIYTSGIGGVYPKGIPVGTILKVVNKKNDIDRYAIVEPLANINETKSVAVILE